MAKYPKDFIPIESSEEEFVPIFDWSGMEAPGYTEPNPPSKTNMKINDALPADFIPIDTRSKTLKQTATINGKTFTNEMPITNAGYYDVGEEQVPRDDRGTAIQKNIEGKPLEPFITPQFQAEMQPYVEPIATLGAGVESALQQPVGLYNAAKYKVQDLLSPETPEEFTPIEIRAQRSTDTPYDNTDQMMQEGNFTDRQKYEYQKSVSEEEDSLKPWYDREASKGAMGFISMLGGPALFGGASAIKYVGLRSKGADPTEAAKEVGGDVGNYLMFEGINQLAKLAWKKATIKNEDVYYVNPEEAKAVINEASQAEKEAIKTKFPSAEENGITLTKTDYREWIQPAREFFGGEGGVSRVVNEAGATEAIVKSSPASETKFTGGVKEPTAAPKLQENVYGNPEERKQLLIERKQQVDTEYENAVANGDFKTALKLDKEKEKLAKDFDEQDALIQQNVQGGGQVEARKEEAQVLDSNAAVPMEQVVTGAEPITPLQETTPEVKIKDKDIINQLYNELSNAEVGKRIYIEATGETLSQPSTYPSWFREFQNEKIKNSKGKLVKPNKNFGKQDGLEALSLSKEGKTLSVKQQNFVDYVYERSGLESFYENARQEALSEINNTLTQEDINEILAAPDEYLKSYIKNNIVPEFGIEITTEELRNVLRGKPEKINKASKSEGVSPVEGKAEENTKDFTGDIDKWNADQKRINAKKDQESALAKEKERIARKYGREGKESIDRQQSMFGNETTNEGVTQGLFSGKTNASVGDYAENNTIKHEKRVKENEEYAGKERNLIQTPELVEIFNAISNGELKVVERFRNPGVRGQAQGENIKILADLAKGRMIASDTSPRKENFDEFKKIVAEMHGGNIEDYLFKIERSKGGFTFKAFDKSETQLLKTLSHEIGHVVDYLPEETMKRGGLLGKIASLKTYMKHTLANYPGSPDAKLSVKDRNRLKEEARKLATKEVTSEITKKEYEEVPLEAIDIVNVWNDVSARETNPKLVEYIGNLGRAEKKLILLEALKGNVASWVTYKKLKEKISTSIEGKKTEIFDAKKYEEELRKLIREEMIKRGIFQKEVIKEELIELSRQWRPWNRETAPESFVKYRDSANELYADAVSAILNNPELIRSVAPQFYKAFHNYLGNKPDFKKIYDEVNERILAGPEQVALHRLNVMRESYRNLDKKAKERAIELAKPKYKHGYLEDIKLKFVDENTSIYNKLKKSKNKLDAALLRGRIEELNYSVSEGFDYMREVDNQVMKIIEDTGLPREDLSAYLTLRRATTEREFYNNPFGQQGSAGKETLEALKESIGKENLETIEEALSSWWKLRKELVIKKLNEAKMHNDEFLEYIKDNENYVNFLTAKYIDRRYGASAGGSGAIIHKQVGTFSANDDPFTATVINDLNLIRAASKNNTAKLIVKFMHENFPNEIFPAETRWVNNHKEMLEPSEIRNLKNYPEGFDPKDYGLVRYLDKGKFVGFYVDSKIAKLFKSNHFEASKLVRALVFFPRALKMIFVGINPAWMVRNLSRDTQRFMKNEAGLKAIPYMIKALPDAWLDAFKDISTPTVREMYQNKELIIGRAYDSTLQLDTESQWKRLIESFKGNKGNVFSKFGQFTERLTKIAGHMYLKDQQKKAMLKGKDYLTDWEIASIVRSQIGTPDVLAKGQWTPFTNNMILFSNPGTQGIRGDYTAFKRRILQFSLYLGALSFIPLIYNLLQEDGSMGEETKDIMARIPSYDKARSFIIPQGITPEGKAIYFALPLDPIVQMFRALTYRAIHQESQSDVKLFLKELGVLFTFSGSNPLIEVFDAVSSYAYGRNKVDSFTGRPVVEDTAFKAGGPEAWKDIAAYSWNKIFGGLFFKFETEDRSKIVGDLEKVLKYPGIGPFINSILKVSDRGLLEEDMDKFSKIEKENAKKSLFVKDQIRKEVKGITTIDEARDRKKALYFKLKDEGILTIKDKPSFETRFAKEVLINIHRNESGVKSVLAADSVTKREALFSDKPELQVIYDDYKKIK